jgi:CBS-domain-containing membrane protein
VQYAPGVPEYYNWAELSSPAGEPLPEPLRVEQVDRTVVRDIMTPVVFSVAPDCPVQRVVRDMLALRVHRLFVVDSSGVLVGVVSAMDVLRHLDE